MKSQKIMAMLVAIAMSSAVSAKDISVQSTGVINAHAFDESKIFETSNQQLNIVELSEIEMKSTTGAERAYATFPSMNTIDWGNQDKHIYGTNNYRTSLLNAQNLGKPYKSVLTANPNSLVPYLGTGQQKGLTIVGLPGSKETFNVGRMIGFYDAGGKGYGIPTTTVTAHYSGKGVHFVPARPLLALGYNPNVGVSTSGFKGGINNVAGGGLWGNVKIWGSHLNRPLY